MEKTPISSLQEYCVRKHLPLPQYEFLGQTPEFKCICMVTKDAQGVGVAISKKAAKHEAAKRVLALLDDEGIYEGDSSANSTNDSFDLSGTEIVTKNAIGELNEFCSKNGLPYPTYDFQNVSIGYRVYCKLSNNTTSGEDIVKKVAKQKAANSMLERVLQDPHIKVDRIKPAFIPNIDTVVTKYNNLKIQQSTRPQTYKNQRGAVNQSVLVTNDDIKKQLEGLKQSGIGCEFVTMNEDPLTIFARISYPGEKEECYIKKGDNVDSILSMFLKEINEQLAEL